MTQDARFGLPLSLVEALEIDPSPVARTLAALLDDAPAPRQQGGDRPGGGWRAMLAGLSLAMVGAAQAHAAGQDLTGLWRMTPTGSHFQEAVTGPAPDAATWTVTRDDGDRLAYELVESRHGAPVVRGAYDVSLADAPSRSLVGGAKLGVTAVRDPSGDVVIRAPKVGALQALIRVRRTGRDTAVLEHAVEGVSGSVEVERISLVRTAPSAAAAAAAK